MNKDMDSSKRRPGGRVSVAAGSVWETRMKNDEVKGGIKVFNGEETNSEENVDNGGKLRRGQTVGGVAVSGKRKTWKSESFDGFDKSPIQFAKGKMDSPKNCDAQCKELSVSVDGIKRSTVHTRKGRSEGIKELSLSVDGIERSLVPAKTGKSEGSKEIISVAVDGIGRSPIQTRKTRSEGIKEMNVSLDGIERSPNLKKGRSEVNKEIISSSERNEKNPIDSKKPRSEITAKESGESCKEIVESCPVQLRKTKSESVNGGNEKNSVQLRKVKSESNKVVNESEKVSEGPVGKIEKNPVEIEKNGSDNETCKEFGVCEEKIISSNDDNNVDGDDEEEIDDEEEEEFEEIEVEIEKKSVDIKEINVPEEQEKPKKIVNEVRKVYNFNERRVPISSSVNKQPPPVVKRTAIYSDFTTSIPNEYRSFPETQNRLQHLVDLVMWRDVSKSAFIFGIGTFIVISSSYTKDLNISFISVISYLGLVYLAAIFLYRSIICRGFVDMDNSSYVLGEEEAVWLLKLFLPYLNEFLLKLKALFSGDPATTMKLAVLLFVLARCGSSITIWKMAKLGFFGVFIIPKVCSSYSTQLTAYGKFLIIRVSHASVTCSHKKAVAAAIFTLVWNLSSIVARIWAAFMLFVAVRYYQQSMVSEDWVEEDLGGEETRHRETGRDRQARGPTIRQPNKLKKVS